MRKLIFIIGLITTTIGLIFGILYITSNYLNIAIITLATLGLISLLVLFLKLFFGPNWVIELLTKLSIGTDIEVALTAFLSELPSPKTETTSKFVTSIILRLSQGKYTCNNIRFYTNNTFISTKQFTEKSNDKVRLANLSSRS